ncbi:MAG: hypothetical protein ACLP50_35590 [Solirubrobacteraceae bacterium]
MLVLIAEDGTDIAQGVNASRKASETGRIPSLAARYAEVLAAGCDLARNRGVFGGPGSGMRVAMVETCGHAGHAPARRASEKANSTSLPVARYFNAL